jgi:hypothetical protein
MKNLLNIYKKESFTQEDHQLINSNIDEGSIDTFDIKENFMEYVYENIGNEYKNEYIWEYTDEYYENGLTHIENYNKLIKHLESK